MPTSLGWRQRGPAHGGPGGGMFLKTGGGKFLKNSAATGGMIQKNDTGHRPVDPAGSARIAVIMLGAIATVHRQPGFFMNWSATSKVGRGVPPPRPRPSDGLGHRWRRPVVTGRAGHRLEVVP